MADKTDDLIISISTDTANIRRALKRLEGDISSVSGNVVKKFDAMSKGIDNSMTTAMQARINQMVGVGTKASKEWTGVLAQQGAELERLRSKYNPVFAAIKQYQASVVSIQQAQRVGALSSNEMTAAIQRERKATLDNIAAIKQRNSAVASMKPVQEGARGFQTANIAAQFQDIAVTSAMGMSPIQIALQQGTQLSAVFNEMGKGKAVLEGIKSAFLSIVSPVSLVTIGVIAAGAALFQYISTMKSDLPTVDEAMERHSKLIQQISERWPGAAEGMQRYLQESTAVMQASARENVKVFQKAAKEAAAAFNSTVGLSTSITGGAPTDLVATRFKPFEEAINRLRAGVKSGRGDFEAFYRQINEIVDTDPKGLRDLGDTVIDLAAPLDAAEQKVSAARASIGLLGGVAAAQVQQISQFTAAMRELASISIPELDARGLAQQQYEIAINRAEAKEGRDDAYRAYQATLARIENQERLSRLPVPSEKPNRESEAPEKVRTSKTERKAERDANAYRDLVKSAQDRIDQMQLEEQLIGKTGVAADTLRMRLDLLQRAQDKGRELSPSQQKELEALAHAYGEAAQKVAALSAAEELRFEREQMFRSPAEQRVAGQLRNMGLDANSDFGQLIAGQIRLNEKLAEGRDLAKDFVSGFTQDLLNGVSAMDALANAASRLGSKLLDMAMDQAINGLFGNLMGVFSGGLGGGSPFANSGQLAGAFASGIGGMWAEGGYTGSGGKYDPAGIVHKGEYVIPKWLVDKIGVGNIERLFAGYSSGGLVGASVPTVPALRAPRVPDLRMPNQSERASERGQVDINVNVSGARGNSEIQQMVADGVSQGLQQYDREMLPQRFRQIARDPYAVG